MASTLHDLEFLVSSTGSQLLERLTHEDLNEANTLRLLTALRKDYAPAQAGAALYMSLQPPLPMPSTVPSSAATSAIVLVLPPSTARMHCMPRVSQI